MKPPELSCTALGAGIGLVAPWANVLEALAIETLSSDATNVLRQRVILVGGLEHFSFFHILGMMIQSD